MDRLEWAHRAANRADQLERLIAGGAPQIIIDKQLQLIREALASLGSSSYPPHRQ